MKHEEILEEFQRLAGQLGVTIRYERGDFDGGYCILKKEKILLINKRLLPRQKAAIIAHGMREIGLDNIFVKPAIRDYIEDEAAKSSRSPK